jgi:hypothetical protein
LNKWEQTDIRKGTFGNYTVHALKYESENGETGGWHTTSWPDAGSPVHDYWVSNGEFRSLSIHHWYNLTNGSRIRIHGKVEPVDPDEKEAVLRAIGATQNKKG